MKEIKAHGFAEFMKIVSSDDLKGKAIFCLFSGDKDANGKSWCPDCVVSEPVVRSSLDQLDDPDAVFVYCAVGGREYWKDQRNEFRQNLKLTGVPTLMKWGKPNQKLVEKEIKADLIAMMLESED